MSWFGFQTIHFAWLFLLAIPVILFYFLKLKRPQQAISSLVLWQQVMDDQRVNSPFQRFKRNMLLLFQLLLLLLLVLALMQPFFIGGAETADYRPVLIDCSASMGVREIKNGETRLDQAKQEVKKIINGLTSDQRIALISVDNTAHRLTEFTNDKRLLLDALDQIEVKHLPSKLDDALRMAQAMSRTVPVEEVLLFSDGNFPEEVKFDLPFVINYQQFKSKGANLAITSFNAQRAEDQNWNVFMMVEAARGKGSADLKVFKNGEELEGLKEELALSPELPHRSGFQIESEAGSRLELRLVPHGHDTLESDNIAYLTLPETRDLKIFVSPKLRTYRHALSNFKNIDVYPVDGGDADTTTGDFDLIISDEPGKLTRNAKVEFYVGQIPEEIAALVSPVEEMGNIVDWFRNSALLEHVLLRDLVLNETIAFAEQADESALQEYGYEILVHGQKGPLVLQKQNNQKVQYYSLVHTDKTTLPYRIGFPILVSNLVKEAQAKAGLSEVYAFKTGVLPELNTGISSEYSVDGPAGISRKMSSDETGRLAGIPAPFVGEYTITDGGETVAVMGASLINQQESSLVSHDEIRFEELAVSASEELVKSDRQLWRTLALLAFGILMLEWWFYQRRPGGSS